MYHNTIKKWSHRMRRWYFKMTFFLIFSQIMRHPLIKLFHLSNLSQMPEDHRMVDTEFSGNFSSSCKRISLNEPLSWLLLTSECRPLSSSSSSLSSPLQNFLNHHCTVCSLAVPGPNVVLMLQVVCTVLLSICNLNKKITQICLLFNIIFSLKYI